MLRHFFVADDIGDDSAAADLEDAKDFLEKLPLRFGLDQVEDAIGNDHIDRVARDQRMLHA